MPPVPRPIEICPPEELGSVRVVLTDIDDTLTTDGVLLPTAYQALGSLKEAGMIVIPVTGRPAGWCDLIARLWPVDAVVGENGAFYFRYDRARRTMKRRFARNPAQRRIDRERLETIRQQLLSEVEGCAVASDQAYRVADLAIDFQEDVPALPCSAVDRIVGIFERHGAHAKVSSIHVNGWFGDYDKLTMTRCLLDAEFGIDIDATPHLATFVGDSPNDQPMFAFFPNAVGVANISRFLDRLQTPPRWVTEAACGEGFAEFAETLIRLQAEFGERRA